MFPQFCLPKDCGAFWCFTEVDRISLLRPLAAGNWLKYSPGSTEFTRAPQPVAAATKRDWASKPASPVAPHHHLQHSQGRSEGMALKVTKSFRQEPDFWEVLYQLSISTSHPSLWFSFFLKCYLWGFPQRTVVLGTFGVRLFWYFDSLEAPSEGRIISLTLSVACLRTVFSVSVSLSVDFVSLCTWVFCLCLVFESDTANAWTLVRRGRVGLNGGWLGSSWSLGVFGREDSDSSPALLFLLCSGTRHSYRLTCSSSPLPVILIECSSTPPLTIASVSRWVRGLVYRSPPNPGNLPAV